MTRKNEDAALRELGRSIRKWYLEEFGEPVLRLAVSNFLEKLIIERTEKFFLRRLNHLTDEDLIAFYKILQGPLDGAQQGQIPIQQGETGTKEETPGGAVTGLSEDSTKVAKDSGVAKASSASSGAERKGIRRK